MSAFVSFISEEVVPEIDTSSTRLGAVEAVEFYSAGVRGHLNEYVLMVEGLTGANGGFRSAIAKIEQRGAEVNQIGESFGGRKWVVGTDGKLEEHVPPILLTETVKGFVNRRGDFLPTGDGRFCADRLVGPFYNVRVVSDEDQPEPAEELDS